jgi:ribosomal protein L19E
MGTTLKALTMATKKIGRDAGTGQFKTVKEAQKDKKGSIVETIKTAPKPAQPKKSK